MVGGRWRLGHKKGYFGGAILLFGGRRHSKGNEAYWILEKCGSGDNRTNLYRKIQAGELLLFNINGRQIDGCCVCVGIYR